MPAMHAILRRASRRFGDVSGYPSKGQVSNGLGKDSYVHHNSNPQQKPSSLPLGAISKSVHVKIYRTERSDSDVELVERMSGTQDSLHEE